MDKSTSLLIASKQGHTLQEIIQAEVKSPPLAVNLLPDHGNLFSYLVQHACALLVIDLARLDSSQSSFFEQIEQIAPDTEVILLATQAERKQAIEQLQQGAAEYLLFPIDPAELALKVSRILEFQSLKRHLTGSRRDNAKPDELSILDEATQEIIQTLQLDRVLEIVLTNARQISGASVSKIYLTDRMGNLVGGSPGPRAPASETLVFDLAQEAALAQKVISWQKTGEQAGTHQSIASALLIPLLSREKLIGVLGVASKQPAAFLPQHVQWLSVFGGQAAIAIENARLFQDLSSAYIDLAQSREQILRSRNTLQVVFDGISDGLYILDQGLTIRALNHIEAERQGYKPETLIGKSYLSLTWAKAAPELLNQIKESLKSGQETTWISPENEDVPYLKDREFRIYPIRNRIGQIEQVVVFAQDVSERRRWQASLFRSANLAAVGQLAGSVAHQINNPLTVTMTNSQLLMLDTDPQSELYELAAGILKAGERIQNIVTNLLEFSNQERYFFVQTDLIDTIEGALALVIRSIKKANIELIKDYQAQPVLSASISHLKLVWVNLLLNARDAVIDRAEQPQITISTRTISQREVKVAITDNGIGLDDKAMEQLFRPFFTTKPIGKALGLGLYSAHAIIERHRGLIRAYSQPGVTTTFEVILPLDNPRDL